jgi:hypothetical protein
MLIGKEKKLIKPRRGDMLIQINIKSNFCNVYNRHVAETIKDFFWSRANGYYET